MGIAQSGARLRVPAQRTFTTQRGQAAEQAAGGKAATTIELGGCPADLLELDQALKVMVEHLGSNRGRPLAVVSLNLDHVHHFGRGGRWYGTLTCERSTDRIDWLYLLDGAPLVRQAERVTGARWPRLAGSDLIGPVLDAAEANGFSIGFLGGAEDTHDALRRRLAAMRPGLDVRGFWAPTRSTLADPAGSEALAADVAAAGPDILVVGLGKPRQELWTAEYGPLTGAGVILDFGAVVDFLADRVRRAPAAVAEHGLEWAWRLGMEPRRMAGRYLVHGPEAYLTLRLPHTSRNGSAPGRVATADLPRPPVVARRPGARRFAGPTDEAEVAVLTVTHNNEQHVDELIASLREEAGSTRIKVVVADNASQDGTLQALARHHDVIAFPSGGNLGYAAGLNLARRRAGRAGSYLVLNPDLTVAPGALTAMRERLAEPGVGAVVPRLVDADGSTCLSLRREPGLARALGDSLLGARLQRRPGWLAETDYDAESYLHAHPVDWATGAALLVSGEMADHVGDWDEQFFLYSEEVDFFRRLRSLGSSVWFEPRAAMHHVGGGSGGSEGLAALMTVNRVRYMSKHHSRVSAQTYRGVLAVGELLRAGRPRNRDTLRVLVRSRHWGDLPRAEAAPARARSPEPCQGSVIVPAHNEGRVLARTLAPLSALARSTPVEVLVACNGCTDDTAQVARSFPGVRVLETAMASKTAALNLADDAARSWPRLYLDADIEVTPSTVGELFTTLAEDGTLAARPVFRYDLTGATPLVRSYYRARGRVTERQRVLWGAGAYALSEAGRARFDVFPDVTADDVFVDGMFAAHEKHVVGTAPVVVRAPRDLRGLFAVLRRTYRGNHEMAAAETASGPQASSGSTLAAVLGTVRGPVSALDATVYVSAAVTARVLLKLDRRERGWERDDSSRA